MISECGHAKIVICDFVENIITNIQETHLVRFLGPHTELEVIVLGDCELRKVWTPLCLDPMPIFVEGKEERGLMLYDLRPEIYI